MKIDYLELQPRYARTIIEGLLTSDCFPWFYNTTTVSNLNDKENRPQFTHAFYRDDKINSDYYDTIYSVFGDKIPEFQTHKLHRIKANLQVQHADRKIIKPHQDMGGDPGVIYLYYPIDSDGCTHFYDDPEDKPVKSIKPKKGTMIRFDAKTFHTGEVPVHSRRRIVLNFVFGE